MRGDLGKSATRQRSGESGGLAVRVVVDWVCTPIGVYTLGKSGQLR